MHKDILVQATFGFALETKHAAFAVTANLVPICLYWGLGGITAAADY